MKKNTSLPDHVRTAEALVLEHGGLPRQRWLEVNHPRLLSAMFRHPEAFAHVRNPAWKKTKEQWVQLAETVAAENGGFLPARADLLQTHPRLVMYMDHNRNGQRESMAHIPRARYSKAKLARLAVYVKQAEQLAAENGGSLIITAKLQREHNALVCAIRANPDFFAHIPRTRRKTTSLEEHKALAQELARETGFLPSLSTIKRKYSALRGAIRNHPEEFSQLVARDRCPYQTVAEHAAVARRLAEGNDGLLQSGAWLNKNGHVNLAQALYRHPAAFAGIRQEVVGTNGKRTKIKTFHADQGPTYEGVPCP
jgi:hypothetical protein